MTHADWTSSSPALLLSSAPPIAGRAATAAPATGTVQELSPLSNAAPAGPGGVGASPAGNMNFLFVMVAVMVLMIGMSMWSASKEKKKKAQMLSSIGRHDRVQTIGGVLGTVVEVRDDEVVLRVDDATGTKIAFAKSAVQGVLRKRAEAKAEETEPVATRA